MRVFITGASGWVGGGVARELTSAGHTVTALARGAEAAAKLEKQGVCVRRGDLADLDGLRAAAMASDAVIHCAFNHTFTWRDILGVILVKLTGNVTLARLSPVAKADLDAITVMIDGLAAAPRESSRKVFLATSPIAVLPPSRVGSEADKGVAGSFGAFRVASELAAIRGAERGVRTGVIRLPPSVHGAGDTGFVPSLIEIARRTGVSAYPGKGENLWPAVHRDDAALLYRLAMEQLADGTLAPGSVLHAVADEGVPLREVAQAVADRLKLGPAVSRTSKHFGSFGRFAAIDNPASSVQTRRLTGWAPSRPSLLDDVRSEAYAAAPTALWQELRSTKAAPVR